MGKRQKDIVDRIEMPVYTITASTDMNPIPNGDITQEDVRVILESDFIKVMTNFMCKKKRSTSKA